MRMARIPAVFTCAVLLALAARPLVAPASAEPPSAVPDPSTPRLAAVDTPIISLVPTSAEIQEWEAPRTHNFRVVSRNRAGQFLPGGDIQVRYTLRGTATLGSDFDIIPRDQFTFPGGNNSADLLVLLKQDELQEPTETIVVHLEDGEGYLVDPAARELRIEIVDDDDPSADNPDEPIHTVGFSPLTREVAEGAGQVFGLGVRRTFNGQLATGREITIPFTIAGSATEGVDYRIFPRDAFVIHFGNNVDALSLTVLQDTEHEPRESVILRLQDGDRYVVDPAARELRIDIVDDDEPPPPSPSPVPSLTELSPASARAAGPVLLTLRGGGFGEGSRVLVGGEAVPTTFVSASELRAEVPGNVVARLRGEEVEVKVENPPPGGGVSAPLTLLLERPGRPPRARSRNAPAAEVP